METFPWQCLWGDSSDVPLLKLLTSWPWILVVAAVHLPYLTGRLSTPRTMSASTHLSCCKASGSTIQVMASCRRCPLTLFFFFSLSWGVSTSWALKNEEVLVGFGARQSYGGLRKAIPTGWSVSCLFNRKIDDVPPFSSGLVWIYLFQYILLCCQKRNSCHLRAVTSVALSNMCMGQGNQVSSCNCHCWSSLITHW